MFDTVAIPLWALIPIALFAALSFLERIIGPGVRWFFRKRAERVVAELNKRLERPIEPFKLARRFDMIQRLIHDGEVAHAIVDHAKSEGVPEQVAREKAERYAREIVPSFSASAYFGFGTRASRWVSDALFHVQLGKDGDALTGIDPEATVVFVINHRSNMDYILVTWLAAKRSALSYAVGEWARVWPLSGLIRTMGAYFIRRRSLNPLYRKVLQRYVQLATEGGVTQAVFPEGGLSLDGRLAPLKLGLLNYIVTGFKPEGRDVVFVPVALNYDRILEDRVLIAADEAGTRRFRASIPNAIQFALRQIMHRLRGRLYRFGHAAVSYGDPISLARFAETHGEATTEHLAAALRDSLQSIVPVLSVPLLAAILEGQNTMDKGALKSAAVDLANRLREKGARLHFMPDDLAKAIDSAIDMLVLRRLLAETNGQLSVVPKQKRLITFYANSIRHLPGMPVSDPHPTDQP